MAALSPASDPPMTMTRGSDTQWIVQRHRTRAKAEVPSGDQYVPPGQAIRVASSGGADHAAPRMTSTNARAIGVHSTRA
jgi:hypothetical protein